jgi:hypothetical protein
LGNPWIGFSPRSDELKAAPLNVTRLTSYEYDMEREILITVEQD